MEEKKNVQQFEELNDDELESTSGGLGVAPEMKVTVYCPRCNCANKVSNYRKFTCSNCGMVVTR